MGEGVGMPRWLSPPTHASQIDGYSFLSACFVFFLFFVAVVVVNNNA